MSTVISPGRKFVILDESTTLVTGVDSPVKFSTVLLPVTGAATVNVIKLPLTDKDFVVVSVGLEVLPIC